MQGEVMSEGENSNLDSSEEKSNISVMEEMIFENEAIAGTPLAEIFSISLNTEGQIYGTIRVEDNNGSFFLYNVDRNESWFIKQEENLVLSQATRAICAEGRFTLFFNLKDKIRGDVELISRECCPDIHHFSGKHMVVNVEGNIDSIAKVEYTVFDLAIEANIWVEFNSDHEAALSQAGLDVEGTILACVKYQSGEMVHDIDDPNKNHQIKLFDFRLTGLRDNNLFPLDRPIVVLPVNCILSIVVNLNVINKDATWKFEEEFCPDDILYLTSHRMHEEEYGIVKIGCDGYRYIYPLQTVESMKELTRKKEKFV